MTLSEILIATGVTPDDLHPDCRFIAQDHDSEFASQFKALPMPSFPNEMAWAIREILWSHSFMVGSNASDWKIPLSVKQFAADFAAHQVAKQ